MSISIKTEQEIAIMRKAGHVLAEIMRKLEKEIKPGIDTLQLNKLAEELVFAHGGKAAFKGYGEKKNPFPGTICASINDEVVHGIPNAERIWKGTVSLPIYPELSEESLEYICQTIKSLLDNKLTYSILAEQSSIIQVHDNQLLNNVSN